MIVNFEISNKSAIKEITNKNVKSLTAQEKEKLKDAAFDFQAVLIEQMLKSMRETQLKDENAEEGYGNEIYTELFDLQIAKHLSRNSNFGIAEKIYKSLTGEEIPKNKISPKSSNTKEHKIYNYTPNPNQDLKIPTQNNTLFDKVSKFENIISTAAEKFDLDSNLIKAIIAAESGGNENAISKAKAKGLMQLMDDTAKDLGVDNAFNPSQNIIGGAKYLSDLLEKYNGNLDLALAAYNAGPGAVDKYNGVPPYDETMKYIDNVKNYFNIFKQRTQEIALNE